MKVGFIVPLSIAAVNGGVRTQTVQTANALQKLGVEIEFISPWQKSIEVDLIHVFVAGPDTLGLLTRCSEIGIKSVLSPVFFSNRSASIISSTLKVEKLLANFGSGIRSEFGIKAEACKLAHLVLPNTYAEAKLIKKGFGVDPSKIDIIPNGVESRFAEATPDLFEQKYGLKNFILFVGQAGAPRKNFIKLAEAAPNIDSQIVVIGSLYTDDYGKQCRELAEKSGNITFIDTLEHDSDLLASAYAACHTFVLPSLFETPGIAAMEAALAGANIVITKMGGAQDYFRDWAEYVSPKSTDSIVKAVNESLKKKNDHSLRYHIIENYTWDKVAQKTYDAYQKMA